ncbi:hypothetical protein NL676_016118 [Syzygium grande]|nr:hypothetical protein NL676_016118 [Syzygium grande]
MALATFTDNMSVPLPFGLDESCSWNSKLVLTCDHASGNLYLFENVPLFDIFVENGYRALDCYDETGGRLDRSNPHPWIQLGEDWHYTLSDIGNKLIVFGCDTLALISDTAGTFGSGCFSYCHKDVDFTVESACSGLGCCPQEPQYSHGPNDELHLTFVVDQESFDVSDYKLPVPEEMGKYVFSRVVVDWVVERNLTCKKAQSNQSSYACGANSNCSDFENGNGYRCFYQARYTGNPYASLLYPLP